MSKNAGIITNIGDMLWTDDDDLVCDLTVRVNAADINELDLNAPLLLESAPREPL